MLSQQFIYIKHPNPKISRLTPSPNLLKWKRLKWFIGLAFHMTSGIFSSAWTYLIIIICLFIFFSLLHPPIYFFVFLNFLLSINRDFRFELQIFGEHPRGAPAWFAEHSKQSNSTAACILTEWVWVAAVIESNESTVWQEAIINLCKKAHKTLSTSLGNFSEGFTENRSEPERLWLAHVGFRLLLESFRSKSDTRQPSGCVESLSSPGVLDFLTPYHGSLFALFPFLRCLGKILSVTLP